MEQNRADEYMHLTMQTFLQIGGNISTCGGVILFDNYEDAQIRAEAQEPFVSRPMKMQSNVLVVCRKGFFDYRMDCGNPMRQSAGSLVFCKQGLIVEFLGASHDLEIMFIAISTDYIMTLERFMPPGDNALSMRLTPSPELFDEIHTHYRLMKSSIENSDEYFRESIIHSYVYILLMKLVMAYNREAGNRSRECTVAGRNTDIYRGFVALVKDNFRQHRNVDFYASALFVSSGHLSRIIKSLSGRTVRAWVRDYVILEAKIMLHSSQLTISQISDSLNFPNPSFFSKYFRLNTGMTPGQYRKT